MSKNLVIVESPTKAKTIGKMLGRNYKIVATVGHLRDLPKSKMGIDIENDFEPKYINVRGKGPIIKDLKDQYKKADKVYLATDPDREGEAISWHLGNILGISPEEKNRVEFQEITKETVKKAMKEPRAIDMDLVDAQQARRVIDRIVGYNLSPLLWKKVKSGLSAGRVQSVALRLVCEREEEIQKFTPEEYWSIVAKHEEKNLEFPSNFAAVIKNNKEEKLEIKNEKEADKLISNLDKDNFIVKNIKKTKRKRNPYAPYTTSTLQQDAYRRLGFTTGKTMTIAQQLYEGINIGDEGTVGLISYMRTDSTRLSQVIIDEAINFIKNVYGDEYATKGNPYGKNKKGAQDAHEGIRPSSINRTPLKLRDYLTDDQYKLYRLIWERIVSSQMQPAEYESTSVDIINGDYLFRANGNIEIFKGFTIVYNINDKDSVLPELKEGEKLKTLDIEKNQHFTKPKPRYTEASLVKVLEEDGIGRPSTYASIISSLTKRHYVEIKEKKFHTTEIGEKVNDFLIKYFDDIVNEEFTAELETELDKIAEEHVDWKEAVRDFYSTFEVSLNKAQKDKSTSYKVTDEKIDEFCPDCNSQLVIKHGRNGKFIGCSNFPDCKFTKAIVKKVGVKCPKCGGDLVEKVSKRGKLFFGCSNYPKCDFALWDRPTGEKCPKCDSLLIHKKNRKVDEVKCSNQDCDYIK